MCAHTATADKAKCSSVAKDRPPFCGSKHLVLNLANATKNCAADKCNNETESDIATCCKDRTKATCSSIASVNDFCPPSKIYANANAAKTCASWNCDKANSGDIGLCCIDKPKAVCSSMQSAAATFCPESKVRPTQRQQVAGSRAG